MKPTNLTSPTTVLVNARHAEMDLKIEKKPFRARRPAPTFSIRLDRRVNSLETALLSEKLAAISGFTSSYGPAEEWPVWESDECPQESVDLLRRAGIRQPNDDDLPRSREQIFPLVEDILGLYLSDCEIVVLFPNMIRLCADALEVSYEAMYEVVLAHELAHAVTHRCISSKSYTWNLFSEATSESKELLAQLIPFTYFSRQECAAHLEAMDKLSDHQSPKYNAYKTSVAPSSSTKALPELIIQTRIDEESRVRGRGTVELEWSADYQEAGKRMYSVRDTGVVFVADDLEGIFNPMAREVLPYRVLPGTLGQIIETVKHLAVLLPYGSPLNLFARGTRGDKSSVNFRVDYGDHFTYYGKADDWGTHTAEFQKLIELIKQGVSEAT